MKNPFFTPDNENPEVIQKIDIRAGRVKEFLAGKDVLDMGCGSCYSTKEYAKVAKSVIGIDIDENAIKYAREHYPSIDVCLMDASGDVRFKGKFDAIVATEVLEHMTKEDGLKALGNVRTMLRKGGMFIGSVPTEDDRGKNEFHKSFYTKEELSETLGRFFKKVDMGTLDFLSPSWFFVCHKEEK